jgi:hypothetical protein
MNTQLLDPVSIPVAFVLFAVVSLACYELGFRVGRWWQDRMPGEQEGPTDMLVGSLLALMAFLLAVTMGMASDRFDTRRGWVVADANAILSTYTQAEYLPQPQTDQIQELLREYLPLRVAVAGELIDFERSVEIQEELLAITADVARSGYLSDLVSSFGDTLTGLVTTHEARIAARRYARVPETVLLLLLVGSALSLGMVGYSAGLRKRRSLLTAVGLVFALGAVLMLVVDLDRPQDGFLEVSQQPLFDVQRRIGPPSS